MISDLAIERCLLQLLAARGPMASVCPSEVARSLLLGAMDWRELMPRVRDTAGRMATAGVIRVIQGQREVMLDARTRGPVRLRRGPGYKRPGAIG